MHKILMLSFLASLSAPASAIYKCESNGQITYSDEPCSNGKSVKLTEPSGNAPLPADKAKARQQATREKNELKRLENQRQQLEAQEDKERQKLARADAIKRKKCENLALQQKWAEEDAAAASGKSADKARRIARRKAEKFQMECGK
jgi:hypothetical protein